MQMNGGALAAMAATARMLLFVHKRLVPSSSVACAFVTTPSHHVHLHTPSAGVKATIPPRPGGSTRASAIDNIMTDVDDDDVDVGDTTPANDRDDRQYSISNYIRRNGPSMELDSSSFRRFERYRRRDVVVVIVIVASS